MSDREMRNHAGERVLPAPLGFPGGDTLSALRQAGEQMLAAADDVIRRTLSGDSPAFVRASRQEGGE